MQVSLGSCPPGPKTTLLIFRYFKLDFQLNSLEYILHNTWSTVGCVQIIKLHGIACWGSWHDLCTLILLALQSKQWIPGFARGRTQDLQASPAFFREQILRSSTSNEQNLSVIDQTTLLQLIDH